MIYESSTAAVAIFALFVGLVLGLSFYLGRKAKSAKGYYAAHGQINWFVNGVAFAGDYLSAASFLGICGMIAVGGYDGFLYSIGYLAGWIVALFVIAEPIKRLGRFTFADALDSKFNSPAIKLAVAISTLVVSVFYLIPQMVGAGALVKPLLGWQHYQGVLAVGVVVTLIVVTAGMVSTTWVQFIKGSLLVVFCTMLTVMILGRGLSTKPEGRVLVPRVTTLAELLAPKLGNPNNLPLDDAQEQKLLGELIAIYGSRSPDEKPQPGDTPGIADPAQRIAAGKKLSEQYPGINIFYPRLLPADGAWKDKPFVRVYDGKHLSELHPGYWRIMADGKLIETQVLRVTTDSTGHKVRWVNGKVQGKGPDQADFSPVGRVHRLPGDKAQTGPLGPLAYLATLQESTIEQWSSETIKEAPTVETTVYFPRLTPGKDLLYPGSSAVFGKVRGEKFADKLDFISLMLALFCGTASLPHILIRYYTVKDQASARKSTVVGIASIGFFYVLTLFLGLGAMTSGVLDPTDPKGNMAAPLLAHTFGQFLFAVISAIAFTTVLGTVSGLIMAGSGAVAHDLLEKYFRVQMDDHQKVFAGKVAAVVLGAIAMLLGIAFEKMNVTFLVGWAFNIAASANLPSLVMLLFWKRTTKQGIASAVTVGMLSSLAWVLLSAATFKDVYGWDPAKSPVPFSQPGLVTIPLGFVVLVLVSLMTQPRQEKA